MRGSDLGEYWRYRVGDYRIVARLNDEELVIIVIRVGHRREVYR
jgi:mRNA interferase RelE/StbE